MWEYRAALALSLDASVHDGDTVKVLLDLGFDVRTEKWVRLADVSAPELGQPGGGEARMYVRSWLGEVYRRSIARPMLQRWPLLVITQQSRAGEPGQVQSFARYVGTVRDIVTGESLNAAVNDYLAAHPEWPRGM